jgi:hypothetical protein
MSNVTSIASKSTPKIAREVAETEFERMCTAHRIEHDAERDEAEQKEWNDMKAPLVRMLMRGSLIIAENGNPTYTPSGGAGLTFHQATGATWIALETYAGAKNMSNMIAAMAELTHTDRASLSKLDAADFQACLKVTGLFLSDR